jgi:hypothetical protein
MFLLLIAQVQNLVHVLTQVDVDHERTRQSATDTAMLQCKERLIDCFDGNTSLAQHLLKQQNCSAGQKLCPSLGCIDATVFCLSNTAHSNYWTWGQLLFTII